MTTTRDLPADALVDFNGLEAVRLTAPDGATALVTLHGAQVLSWIPAGGREQLYLSPYANYERDCAIRGGIPVVFPQFADFGPLPRHGFARTSTWELSDLRRGGSARVGDAYACAVFTLNADSDSRALWPHAFRAELTVLLGAQRLDLELEVVNEDPPGEEEFAFTAALHSYLAVGEVEESTLAGLRGARCIDRAGGGVEYEETGVELAVDDEVDRIYQNVSGPLLLRTPQGSIGIHQEGFSDTVVWNPWEWKCGEIGDLPENAFRRFLCVEAAQASTPVTLAAGESWWGRQSLVRLQAG